MCIQKIVNSIGLGFDIIGAFLLLKFHVISKYIKESKSGGYIKDLDKNEFPVYRKWSIIGFFLLIFGFLLQIFSNFL